MLAAVAAQAATDAGVPAGAIVLVAGGGREELAELATQEGVVDLIVPRGGEGLKAALKGVATVPVIYAASGNCHVYVDASADLDAAQRIVLNAKAQRPGVCNAAETLLVHADAAPAFLPRVLGALREAGVELRVDGRTHALAGEALAGTLADATDEDWDTEFLAMILAVGIVDSVGEAIAHVNAHGSGHSEAIVTDSAAAARAFERGVDAPASTSTPRRASPTAASSAWAPRSATRPRSCTRAGRSGCASCAPSSTSSAATGTSGAEAPPAPALHRAFTHGSHRHPRRHVQSAAHGSPRHGAGGARPAGPRSRRVPAGGGAAAQGGARGPGAGARVELCRLAVAGDERFGCRRWRSTAEARPSLSIP